MTYATVGETVMEIYEFEKEKLNEANKNINK